MRKQNPADIRSDFEKALDDVTATANEVLGATLANGATFSRKTTKMTAESSLLTAAILWEGFVSDLMVAYVNGDSSGYAAYAEQQLLKQAQSKYGADIVQSVSVTMTTHIKVVRVRELLDDKGYNVTFKSVRELVDAAQNWLTQADAQKFTALSQGQRATLDAAHALRNFLAHRSKASKERMATALAYGALPAGLGRGTNDIHDVGSFLVSTPVGHQQLRLNLYLDAIKACAATVCP